MSIPSWSNHDAHVCLRSCNRPATPDAKRWLLDQLGTGEELAAVIERRSVEACITEATMRRARKDLGVESHPHIARGPRFLRLPDSPCLAQRTRDAQQLDLSVTGYLSKSDLQTSATDDDLNVAGEESDGNNIGSFAKQLVGRRADGLPTQTTTSTEPPSNLSELVGESVDLGDEVRI